MFAMTRGIMVVCMLVASAASASNLANEHGTKRRPVANLVEEARAARARTDSAESAVEPAGPVSVHAGSLTLPAPIQSGLTWLIANQNADGSWGQSLPLVETAAVVETLSKVDPGGAALATGALWLAGQNAVNHEYLARQIIALAGVPDQKARALTLAQQLLTLRNAATSDTTLPNWPEGGWGIAPGYETDCLTTAMALLALDRTGFNGGFKVTNRSLAGGATNVHQWTIAADAVRARILITVSGSTVRLRMKQGSVPTQFDPYFSLPAGGPYLIVFPDSGLPFTSGTNYISVESPTPPALAATYTMTASYETPTFDTRTLAEPLDYLTQSQNPGGGWGLQRGQATDLYTTFHVLMAILRYQQYDLVAATASAVTYVKSQQLGDGSFGFGGPGIPYATALGALGLMRSEHCSFSTNTERAITALLAMQAANGSWSNQPYDTSLAMLALTEHGNDSDGDGVKDDGDCSGAVEDHPCPNGVTSACDDNCTVVANPGQQNADNDRRGDACDCSNSNAQAWSTPSDVALSLFHYPEFGRTEVNWGAAADNGGSVAAVYDTLRSNDPSSFQAPAICVESNQPDTMSTDFDMPASGASFFFLVRVVNGCPGPGNMGTNSSGVPRTGRSCP